MKRKIYACFVDYQKAFDRVKHDKLVEVMRRAGIPELEMKLISLYWNQYATVKTRNGISRIICIRRGVRQECILFLLYSECMMKDAVQARKGIVVNGQIVDSLQLVCKKYGMDVNVKNTKVMVFSKEGYVQCSIQVNGVYLDQVTS